VVELVSTKINKAFGYESAKTTLIATGGKGVRYGLAKDYIVSKRSELIEICHGENFGLNQEQANALKKIVDDVKNGKASIDDFLATSFSYIMFNWQCLCRDFKDFVAEQPAFLKQNTRPLGVTCTPLEQIVSSGIVSGVGILHSLVHAIPGALKKQNQLTQEAFADALSSMKELSADLAQLHIDPLVVLENFLQGKKDVALPQELDSKDLSNLIEYYKKLGSNANSITINNQNKVEIDVAAFLNQPETKKSIEASRKMRTNNELHNQNSFSEAFGCPASGIIPLLNKQIFAITEQFLMPHFDQIFSMKVESRQ